MTMIKNPDIWKKCDHQKPVRLQDIFNVYTYVVYIKLPFLK